MADTSSHEVRPLVPADIRAAGTVLYEAMKDYAHESNEPEDFNSVQDAMLWVGSRIRPGLHTYGYFLNGQVVAVYAMDLRGPLACLGPIATLKEYRNHRYAKELWIKSLALVTEDKGVRGWRGLLFASNKGALQRYLTVGFQVTGHAILFEIPKGISLPPSEDTSYTVRALAAGDLEACNALHEQCHGYPRSADIEDALRRRQGLVAVKDGQVCAYTTGISRYEHAIAQTNPALQALIRASLPNAQSFHVDETNTQLIEWCKAQGFHPRSQLLLVTHGFKFGPALPYLASMHY